MHKRNEANNSNGYAKPYLFFSFWNTKSMIINKFLLYSNFWKNTKRAYKKVRS